MTTDQSRPLYLATTVNPDEAAAFDRIAAELGINRVELLRQVVREYVAQWGPRWDTIEADWEPEQPSVADWSTAIAQRLNTIEERLTALEERDTPPLALPPPSSPPRTLNHPPQEPRAEAAPIATPPRTQPPPKRPEPEFVPKTVSLYQATTLSPDALCRRFDIDRAQVMRSARLLGVKQSHYLEDLTGWTWDAMNRVFRE